MGWATLPTLTVHPSAVFFQDGNMFFLGRIHRVFLQELHGGAATNQFAFTAVNDLNDVSACFAFIDLKLFCHFMILLVEIINVCSMSKPI
jgi:hypothetical protein